MSLHLKVDHQLLKISLNMPSEHKTTLAQLLPNFLMMEVKDIVIFYVQMTFLEFTQFLSSSALKECQIILPLKTEVEVSGFGAQDQKHFEDFQTQIRDCSSFVLVKKRALVSILQLLDHAIRNQEPWFFSFQDPISVISLNTIKKGFKIDRVESLATPQYPFLYVHINKSVSFYEVHSPSSFTKLSGSIIGDSTIESLLHVMGLKEDLNRTFEEAFENDADNLNVDLTVGDIYGPNVDFTLPKDLIASSMGKAQFQNHESIKSLDVARSLWNIFAINLGMLSAMMATNASLGTVICHSSKLTYEPWLYTLQVVMNAFGEGKLAIYFSEHSEYLLGL